MAVTYGTPSEENSTNEAVSEFSRGTTEYEQFTVPSSAANAVVFDYRGFSGGSIEVDGACSITWYAGSNSRRVAKSTPVAAYDGALTPNALVQVLPAPGVYDLPPGLFGKACIAPIVSSGTPPAAILVLKK